MANGKGTLLLKSYEVNMKKFLSIFLVLVLCFSFVSVIASCDDHPNNPPNNGDDNPPKLQALAKPFVTVDDNGIATWNAVLNAIKYVYKINNGTEMQTKTTAVQLQENDTICVKAVGDGVTYGESVYSATVTYVKKQDPTPTPGPDDPDKTLIKLAAPFVLIDDNGVATWSAVKNAVKYVIKINNGDEQENTTLKVTLSDGDSLVVKAVGDGITYGESAYCSPVVYSKPIDVDGWYVLNSKIIEGMDVTRNYVCNTLKLNKGEVVWREVDITGANETIGVYEYYENSKTLRITMNSTGYSFKVGEKGLQITFSGTVNRKSLSYVFDKDDDYSQSADEGQVYFTQELFGDDITKNFYNYCPTIMMEDSRTMHIWYCSNKVDYNVTDYVAYRKGTLHDDGKWTFTDKQFVLEPTSGTWDERHVCDPSVVKGIFNYNGETYNYMMAYLGCVTSDNTKNEVGVAFAKNPEGPYVKATEINPICDFYKDYNLSRTESSSSAQYKAWGYGQPSLVSVDNAGKILLFFTNGNASGTGCTVRLLDMSNVNNIKILKQTNILPQGITNANGGSDCINNADFAYDPELARLYCVKEDFPYDSGSDTNWITSANTVFYLQLDKNSDDVFAPLFDPSSTRVWQKVGAITEGLTGYKRNHNCGIVTDEYGRLMSGAQLPIVYTMSDLASEHPGWTTPWGTGQWPALHTYRLHGVVFDLI